MTEEIKKIDSENENCVSNENESSETIEAICDRRCKVCYSDYMQEIHLLHKSGRQLSEIVAALKEKYDFEISEASLSRHFTKYRERKQLISAQIINGELVEAATKQAVHAKQVVFLIDTAIAQIQERVKQGGLIFDVKDLDTLMKMRYQILDGKQGADETDILKVWQSAQVIFNQNQLRLHI